MHKICENVAILKASHVTHGCLMARIASDIFYFSFDPLKKNSPAPKFMDYDQTYTVVNRGCHLGPIPPRGGSRQLSITPRHMW